ncbi:cupin domain-containing protein [Aliihoeflea sp. PC F10.4]
MNPTLLTDSTLAFSGRRIVPEEIRIDGAPNSQSWSATLAGASSNIRYGIWEGEVGAASIASYPHDEVFVVQRGAVRMEGANGYTLDIGAGEACYIPCGWAGIWRNVEHVAKTFVIVEKDGV